MFKVGDTVHVDAICKVESMTRDGSVLVVSGMGILSNGKPANNVVNPKFCTLIEQPLKVGDSARYFGTACKIQFIDEDGYATIKDVVNGRTVVHISDLTRI